MNSENVNYFARLFQRIFSDAWLKISGGILLFILRYLFDSLNTSAMVAIFVLILMDTMTGLLAAYRTGTKIQSHKLFRFALKIAVYFVLISSGYVAEHAIPHITFIDETIIAALAITELFSILENVARAGFTVAATILAKLNKELP